MLDLFGNVFGRSKKSASGSNQASTSKQEATTTDEDFVVVPNQGNLPENTLYPYIDFSELVSFPIDCSSDFLLILLFSTFRVSMEKQQQQPQPQQPQLVPDN